MSKENVLPDGWRWTTLGEIADIGTGTTPLKSNASFWNGGTIPWVTSSAVNQAYVTEANSYVTEEAISKTTLRIYSKETLLIALYGEGRTRGKVSELLIDATVNQALATIVLSNELRTYKRFLKYYLQSCYDNLRRQAAGGMQPNLNLGIVKKVEVPIPPDAEQRRIVSKIEELFSDLDAGVKSLERAKANLKRYRASVLKAAVEGHPTADWRAVHPDIEPASELLKRILTTRRQTWESNQLAEYKRKGKKPPEGWKDRYKEPTTPDTKALPELPSGWCWASPDQLASTEPYSLAIGPFGSNLKVSDYEAVGVPLVFVRNIRSGVFGGDSTKFVSDNKARELFAHSIAGGDILITKMGEPPGDTILYPKTEPPAIITADCIKLRLTPLLTHSEYFVWAIKSQIVHQQILKITRGVAQKKISLGRFSTIAIPLPPLEEQAEFVLEIETVWSIAIAALDCLERNRARAGRLRQSILKRAFDGRLFEQDCLNHQV